jgi:bifunctional polynucleotide phosphatase/kinase
MTEPYTYVEFLRGGAIVRGRPLCAFDLDGTLITTQSGRKYPRDLDDWRWLPGATEALRRAHADGALVAIITNQAQMTPAAVAKKGARLAAAAGVPLVLVAGHRDPYHRKPHSGLWRALLARTGFRKAGSVYRGDMLTDALFARNYGIRFEWAAGVDPAVVAAAAAPHPAAAAQQRAAAQHPREALAPLFAAPRLVVLLVGRPAAGKSMLAATFVANGFTLVSRDKTTPSTPARYRRALAGATKFIVDSTNASREARRRWLGPARQAHYRTVIVHVATCDVLARHLNEWRCEHNGARAPDIAFTLYDKKFEPPAVDEADSLIRVQGGFSRADVARLLSMRF